MKTSIVRLLLFVSAFVMLGFGRHAHANPWGSRSVPPATEIQLFINYKKIPGRPDRYDQKVVSTWLEPKSAGYLYFEHWETPSNGACFWGDPEDALNLVQHMVDIFNAESNRYIRFKGEVYYDLKTSRDVLNLYTMDESGQKVEWFPRMRNCIRRSTPAERRN